MKIATDQAQFDAAYLAAQPKPVQDLMNMPKLTPTQIGERGAVANGLAQRGYVIDVPIMVWGWDPWHLTNERLGEGYSWVPSALAAPVLVAPGVTLAGFKSYNAQMVPAGGIIVTLDEDLLPLIFAAPVVQQ